MWRESPLGDLAEITSGGTPSREVSEYWGGDIPWVTPTDITACPTNHLFSTVDRITKKGLLNSSAKVIPAGSILFTSRATVGISRIAGVSVCTNQGFKSLSPLHDVDGTFLFYQVQRLRGAFERFAAGSTFPEINKKDTARVLIPHPENPLTQKKIAAILTSIDTAIEKTESLIAKYQKIKAGLMHDLFTRGVTADGKLRPSSEQAPELYHETVVGWIPKEWELEPCHKLCKRICVGIVIQPTQYYVEDGIPAFRSANVREDGIDPSNFVYISSLANTLLIKSQIKTGDILSVRTGYPGTSSVVPKEFDGSNTIDILISSPSNLINSEFLCDWINSSFGKEQVLRQQGGMAQQHFNVGEMRELLVILPIMEEQLRIRDRANLVKNKLRLEKASLEKLKRQKAGLMQDLLTGKVPVKIDEQVAEIIGG